jgi:uncharacterized membrane protein
MTMLILGLVLFLGLHSVRVVAEDWRRAKIAQWGEQRWKGAYSLISAAGLALIFFGYAAARAQPVLLWQPPTAMRHIAALLTLFAFWLLAAAYVPRNHLKAKLHHPMTLGIKAWALAHLLANQMLADALLFGGFLLWSVLVFRAARQRDRAEGKVYAPGTLAGTAVAIVAGTAAWAAFAIWLHGAWLGVRPFG